MKPIRVFYSPLTQRFYATGRYRLLKGGIVAMTGEKFDVTQDIARAIAENGIVFSVDPPASPE